MKILVITRVWSFIDDTIDVWRKRGDTVVKHYEYNAELAKNADIIFFEFIDPNMEKASKCPIGSKKKIIGRLHRCEYYLGMIGRLPINWNNVDTLIITGKYFYDLILAGPEKRKIGDHTKIVHIPYGVSDTKFTFRPRLPRGKKATIGWLAKGYTWRKDPIKALSCFYAILKKYPEIDWEFIMAAGGGDRGVPEYKDYLMKNYPELSQRVTMHRGQSDVNSYMENFDYFLNTSNNESFCYVIAEACLKGIKPLIYNFESADQLWPKDWTFFCDNEMFDIMEKPYESEKYRQYILDNYSLQKVVQNFDEVFNG